MRSEVYLCDICGRERGEANHWFMADMATSGITLMCWKSGNLSHVDDISHLCSEECCHTLLSRFLGGEKEGQK